MKSILVIGLGRFGRHMARKLIDQGNDVLAIEKSVERADAAIEWVDNVQIGDSTNELFLKALGIRNFDICVVAIGDSFQSTLETIVALKDLGANYIIARASRDVHKKLLLRNGADYVVYAEREMAERLAIKFGGDKICDYLQLTSEYAIYEIRAPHNWCGKTILEKDIRNTYHVSILAIKRNDDMDPMPSAEYRFQKGDTLMVMGKEADIKKITKL